MGFGVSQIDAGSRIEIGGYTEAGDAQVLQREQFELGDIRSLDEVMRELVDDGYMPSFCTACYRLGRTGEHFMEFAIPGFIKRLCTPNGLTTLMEYLVDYASDETRAAGLRLIERELAEMPDNSRKQDLTIGCTGSRRRTIATFTSEQDCARTRETQISATRNTGGKRPRRRSQMGRWKATAQNKICSASGKFP